MTMFSEQTPLGFIGAGAVGGTLAVALAQAGYHVTAGASRTFASAQGLAERLVGCTAYDTAQQVILACDLVFISTPDDAIGAVAAALTWRPGKGVVHCSGATSLEVKAAYRRLMRRYHPDLHHGDREKAEVATRLAQELRVAYEKLLAHLGEHGR